jgi:tetraacyldisaccharide 4'-kinase
MRTIEKVWFQGHPAKWLFVPLLLPLSGLFWLISLLRRYSYKAGLSTVMKTSKPVIVVGNIGVGGNGKTPMVIYLVELTRSLGIKPGVISRGYGGKAPHYPYLLTEKSTAAEAGDEPILIKQRCQVPVAVGSDRIASAELLIEQGCDVIISDDGLQHYRLSRALELIIVDGKRLFGNGLLLPAGPLREGVWRLNTADLVIYNGQYPRQINADNQAIAMNLTAMEICHLQSNKRLSLTDFVKNNARVNAIAAIGSPARFFATLESNDFIISESRGYVDHHAFSLSDFDDFDESIPLVMTEKDAVKCQSFCKDNWWYLPVNASFTQTEQKILQDKINAVMSTAIINNNQKRS